jgi:hypothetical protein
VDTKCPTTKFSTKIKANNASEETIVNNRDGMDIEF